MNKDVYDTVYGIKRVLDNDSISELKDILEARRLAYGRREILTQIVILKSILLDSDGTIKEILFGNLHLPKLPLVIKKEDLISIILDHNKGLTFGLTFVAHNHFLPEDYYICPFCTKGWTVEDMFWCETTRSSEIVSLEKYTGKKLSEVPEILSRERKRACFILDCHNNTSAWVRKGLEKCDYTVPAHEQAQIDIWTYYHRHCHEEMAHQKRGADAIELLSRSGFRNIRHASQSYPKYSPLDLSQHRFQTDFGLIQIIKPSRGRENFLIFEFLDDGNLKLDLAKILAEEVEKDGIEVGEKFFRLGDLHRNSPEVYLSKINSAGRRAVEASVSAMAKKMERARVAQQNKETED